jgi:hypothetical protein
MDETLAKVVTSGETPEILPMLRDEFDDESVRISIQKI